MELRKILGGYPYNYEIDTMKILEKFEKHNYYLSLPKIKNNSKMNFFSGQQMTHWLNKFGIPEPLSREIKYPDVLLIPLVAFDKNFNRVGYGGGFYDRYLKKIKKMKKILTIGLAYSYQKVKQIPVNEYDIKLDFIITEKER